MKQAEIWLINLNPTIGAEINKTRPAVIVSDDLLGRLPLKIMVPITNWKSKYNDVPWMVNIKLSNQNGLTKESAADCFQVRSVSEKRLVRKIGKINPNGLLKIQKSLAGVLSIRI